MGRRKNDSTLTFVYDASRLQGDRLLAAASRGDVESIQLYLQGGDDIDPVNQVMESNSELLICVFLAQILSKLS